MDLHIKKFFLGLVFWSASLSLVSSEPESPTPKEPEKPGYEVTETEIKLPGVTINRAKREVRIDAEVCLQAGILEYVVVRPETFEHEAIFTTTAKPEFVHAALLLCGLKPTPQFRGMSALWTEKAMKQKQSRVKIEVEWKEGKENKRINLTSLLIDREGDTDGYGLEEKNKPKEESKVQDAWIFAGSFLHEDKETGKKFYVANSSGILVGIWPDLSTVIQYGVSSGNPYEGEHLGLEINEELVPKVGTKVKLVFSLHDAPDKKEEEKKQQPKK